MFQIIMSNNRLKLLNNSSLECSDGLEGNFLPGFPCSRIKIEWNNYRFAEDESSVDAEPFGERTLENFLMLSEITTARARNEKNQCR